MAGEVNTEVAAARAAARVVGQQAALRDELADATLGACTVEVELAPPASFLLELSPL